jgi:hypothetical protein
LTDHAARYFILDRKDIARFPIEPFRPELPARLPIDKRCGNPNFAAGTPNAAGQDMAYAQRACDCFRVLRAVPEF